MKQTITCFLLFVSLSSLHAQDDWKKTFANSEAVYTNLNCDVNIKKEDEKWIAVSKLSEDLVYLTDNAVKMMSRGRIYHSSFNELKKWDAYTQLPEHKKIKVANTATASDRQDYIFYDDVKSTSFDFAGASVGATRHVEYELVHKDIHMLSPHYFGRYFPVAEGELNITFPSDIKLKYIIKGLDADKVQFSETKKKDRTTYTFHISNEQSEQSYGDAPDNSYYATHVIYYVEQVKENGEWKNLLASPEDLYNHNYNFIRNVNKELSAELKNLSDSLTKGAKTDLEKARVIYSWVQSHIKYVAFEDGMEGFIPREASLVCSRRFGDCKDMASILTAMLNYVHIPAYFTWIGTRDIPYDYTEVPLPIVDNHMICTIKVGEEYIFLDGTDEGCIFGLPPYHIQGKQAMVGISEKEFKIIRVPVTPKEKNVFKDSTFLQLTDKGIMGKVKISMSGYYASDLQSTLNFKNDKEREDYFKARFTRASNKIRFSNWKINMNSDHSEAIITADLDLPDYARKLGDEWFLNMNLFKWYEHEEIDFPKRKMPIEFNFLKRSSYVTALKIPTGYKVSFLPQSETFKNAVWGFVMNYKADQNNVYLTQEFDTDQLMLYAPQFEPWNKVLEHLFPHYKQTVALTKN